MSNFNVVLVTSFLFNFALDIMETESFRLVAIMVSFFVSLSFILDAQTWFLSMAEKFVEWSKTFFIAYVTCEITLVINLVYVVINKYSVSSIAWYTPSLLLGVFSLYRMQKDARSQ
ncbi:hypothetical protein FMH16_23225 [Vibrio vulnificus]|nr:hypothetical protein [Vibrio vulnificus]EGR0395153.1 hypothetical protein [Vibrio vulnificus]PNG66955.1 hypothetical protein TI06_22275 [Vibrio vulnificus]HAS8106907.1 hypothetical protein [Vibrio vulnificus]HAS8128819.1 hypothetical protein [Vibrio vulnificus]